jgi:hypothetical protein
MTTQPRITTVEAAEIRVFDPEPGTDDASPMYVMEIAELGVTVRVRRTREGIRPVRTSIVAETGHSAAWPVDVSVNGADSTQGEEPDDIECRYCEEIIFQTTGGLWEAPAGGGAAALCPESPDDQHAPEPDEETGKAENYQDGPCGDH